MRAFISSFLVKMNVKEFALQKRQERKGIKKVQKILCSIELSALAVPFDKKMYHHQIYTK